MVSSLCAALFESDSKLALLATGTKITANTKIISNALPKQLKFAQKILMITFCLSAKFCLQN